MLFYGIDGGYFSLTKYSSGTRTGLITNPDSEDCSASLICDSGNVLISLSNGNEPALQSAIIFGMNACGSTPPSTIRLSALPFRSCWEMTNSPEGAPTMPQGPPLPIAAMA